MPVPSISLDIYGWLRLPMDMSIYIRIYVHMLNIYVYIFKCIYLSRISESMSFIYLDMQEVATMGGVDVWICIFVHFTVVYLHAYFFYISTRLLLYLY